MKKLLALLTLGVALSVAAEEELPTEIRLTNGFVMKDCSIVRWEADTLTVKYIGGTVPVRLDNIDPAQRALIESHREEAMKHQAKDDRKEAHQQAEAKHAAEVRAKRDAKRQAELDRKSAAIAQGLESHQVVAGMTMDQVRSMFGPPTRSSSLTNVNASEWWIYAGRGREPSGAPCNLQVHFRAGVATRCNNTQQ